MKDDVYFYLASPDIMLAEEASDYYLRNKDFLKIFEPVRNNEFYTVGYQRKVLEQEIEEQKLMKLFRFYIKPYEQTNKIIGIIGLNNIIWGAFRSAFIGYKLDKQYINSGYMTKALSLVVEFAFYQLHLHRLEANVMPWNKASLKVLEKNGFSFEGLAKKYMNINGVWEDHVHMVKINEIDGL